MAHGVTQPVQDAPPGESTRPAPRRGWRARLRASPAWLYIAALGPGLVAAAAGNDAGGIATYATAGARYGYSLLWAMVLIVLSLSLVQEMCARMGAVTGKGLSDLIRERFGLRWATFATLALLIANTGTTITEFVGIGAAAELFGIPRWLAVPPMAALLWWLVTKGSYNRVEKLFIALSLVFFSYIISSFIIPHISWATIGQSLITPDLSKIGDAGYLSVLVALIGTTITPYMQLYVTSSVVEKGVTPADYKYERVDVISGSVFGSTVSIFIIIVTAATLFFAHKEVSSAADAAIGAVFSNLMSIAMIIATAATLHTHGAVLLQSAADAARALEPVAGNAARALFAIGLLGASLLAGAVLPLATAYAVTETFGQPKGVSLDFRRAPLFFGLFSLLIGLGAVLALIPGVPVIPLLIAVQVFNGALLPVILFFVLRLADDPGLMGELKNRRWESVLGWGTAAMITAAVAVLFGSQLLGLFAGR